MKLSIVVLFVFIVGIYSVNCSYESFLCPREEGGKTAYSCYADCQHQHGAFDGICGNRLEGDYNCYCGKPNVRQVYEKSLMCQEETDYYRNICTVDCQCNHAALGGSCDWRRKACVCQGQGMDKQNSLCTLTNPQDFAKYIVSQVGIEGLGEMGEQLIAPLFKNKQ